MALTELSQLAEFSDKVKSFWNMKACYFEMSKSMFNLHKTLSFDNVK